jgi:hypothetical protein
MVDRIMSTKKYSILYFVVKSLHEQDPKRLAFTKSYMDLPKVMRYSLPEFEKSKIEYSRNYETIKEEVETADKMVLELKDNIEEAENQMCYQIFTDHFKPFLHDADRRLEMIKDNFEKIKSKASKCAELYGLKTSSSPEEVLLLLHSFLESVRKHQETLERLENAAKRKAEYEMKRQIGKESSKAIGDLAINHGKGNQIPKAKQEMINLEQPNRGNLDKEISEGEVVNTNLITSDLSKSQRGHTIYQPPGTVRPTAYGGPVVPILKPKDQAGAGARPQAANRKRVAVNDQYKKKDEKSEKIIEFSSSKLNRTTKFQRETVNLSRISLLQWNQGFLRSNPTSRNMQIDIEDGLTTKLMRLLRVK